MIGEGNEDAAVGKKEEPLTDVRLTPETPTKPSPPTPPGRFPSVYLTLDELRTRYEEEDTRREGVDVKASILLAGSGVILTIIAQPAANLTPTSVIGAPLTEIVLVALIFTVMALALGTAVIALRALMFRLYDRVGGPYTDFYRYVAMRREEFADHFVRAYISALEANSQRTSRRQNWVRQSFTLFALTLTFIAILIVLPVL